MPFRYIPNIPTEHKLYKLMPFAGLIDLQKKTLLLKATLFPMVRTFPFQSTVSTGTHGSGKIRLNLILKGNV